MQCLIFLINFHVYSIIYTMFNAMPTKQEVKPPFSPTVINHTNTDFSEEHALLNKGLKYNFSH